MTRFDNHLPMPISKSTRVSFLGPQGTYSHQAAYDRFGTSVEYCERNTITSVFEALSPAIPLALMPQENSIFGNVIETYDLLRRPSVGQDIFVRGEVTLGVQHCLLVQKGVKLADIRRILSHEQALGQCSRFIMEHLPEASVVKTASTAAAARALSSSNSAGDSSGCAAICSKLCATIFPGLEVLQEGIQNDNLNFTRFYVLAHGCDVSLPPVLKECRRHALVRLYQGFPTVSAELTKEHLPSVTRLLAALGLCATRVDRRPSLQTVPFHDVYFVEVQDDHTSEDQGRLWITEIETGIRRVVEAGGEACLLGTW